MRKRAQKRQIEQLKKRSTLWLEGKPLQAAEHWQDVQTLSAEVHGEAHGASFSPSSHWDFAFGIFVYDTLASVCFATRPEYKGGPAFLHSSRTHSKWRGLGFGQKALQGLFAQLRLAKITAIEGQISVRNLPSLFRLRACGFKRLKSYPIKNAGQDLEHDWLRWGRNL